MKDINTYKNYRRKYKRYYGIDFDENFVVHHIDLNRSNNDINNLLLLPAGLHEKYHLILNALSICPDKTKADGFIDLRLSNVLITDYNICFLDDIAETISDCKIWIDLKRYNYNKDLQISLLGKKVV